MLDFSKHVSFYLVLRVLFYTLLYVSSFISLSIRTLHWQSFGSVIDQTGSIILVLKLIRKSIFWCLEIITIRCFLHGQLWKLKIIWNMTDLLFIMFSVNKMFVVHGFIFVIVQFILLDLISRFIVFFSRLIGVLWVI